MSTFSELQWKKFPVLNDGFVCLVDVMGTDASVVQAARVSYGNDKREDCSTCGGEGGIEEDTGGVNPDGSFISVGIPCPACHEKNRGLIRYMMRHRHGTPFEMCEVKILIRIPMDAWRQMVRHRTANINEYSTRYSEAINSQQTTKPDEWRLQSGTNKQGSSGLLDENNPDFRDGTELTAIEKMFQLAAQQVYQTRLNAGVAREQARKDLPLSTYTEAYWKIDLRNMFHFLGLRMDSHAQQEIREYATVIGEQIIKPLFPLSWEAFIDYQLESISLSRLEIKVLSEYNRQHGGPSLAHIEAIIPNKREREECLSKLKLMGFME